MADVKEMVNAVSETTSNDQPETTTTTNYIGSQHGFFAAEVEQSATNPTTVFANAFITNNSNSNNNFSLSSANQVVKIVDQSAQGRGNALVAVQSIPRGQVIYTERAVVASQIPKQRRRRQRDPKSSAETSRNCHEKHESLWSVRACQYCFRSLEPASSCQGLFATFENNNNNSNNNQQQQEIPALPHAYLWPVAGPVEGSRFLQKEVAAGSPCRRDEFGHLVCCREEMQGCHALFCSMSCHNRFQNELGSCCNITASMHALLDLLQTRRGVNHHDNVEVDNVNNFGNNDHKQHNNPPNNGGENVNDNDTDEETTGEMQEPVVLAIRMFAMSLQHVRQTKTLQGTCLEGLCGESSDLTPLELGWTHEECSAMGWTQQEECSANKRQQGYQSTPSGRYTLRPLYDRLVSIWALTETEQQAISLDRFHQLACMAARNAFDFQTQNPFDVYYSALIRSTGGRNSVNHPTIMAQVSRALGCPPAPPSPPPPLPSSSSSTSTSPTTNSSTSSFGLRRGMDSRIRERVTPEIVAIFPLTARINHSCQPSAYIASQMFVDAHMDLVALKDVPPGEEITNSYIYTGHNGNMASSSSGGTCMIQRKQGGKPRHKRQRELQAKYLFLCHCPLCAISR